MKSRLAMVISVAGVLTAGSAAAIVNSQVLNADASGSKKPSTAAITLPIIPATSPAPTSLPINSVPPTAPPVAPLLAPQPATVPPTVPAGTETVPPTVPPAPSTQAAYQVGESGIVTLDTTSGRLMVVSATPSAGWTVTEARTDGDFGIKVTFAAGPIQVDFDANNVYGIIGTSVTSRDFSAPRGTTIGSSGSSSSGGGSSSGDSSSGGGLSEDGEGHEGGSEGGGDD